MTSPFSPSSSLGQRVRPVLWFGALLLLVAFAAHTITTLPVFRQEPALPWALTFDLLVGVPGLFYCLVVRRYRLPASSVAGVVGGCLALAFWLIPVAQQQPLRALHWVPVLLEISTLVVLATKVRAFGRAYRAAGTHEPLVWPRVRLAAAQVLGLAGVLVVAEIEMLRYALLGWWAVPEGEAGASSFSNYRESGFTAFVLMAGVAVAVETAVVHLLAAHWSPVLARWLLVLDAYTLALLVAHGQAVRLRPTLLTPQCLHLRVGFLWQLTVPRAALLAIAPLRTTPPAHPETLHLSKLLFTTPNLLLTFAETVAVTGPYGTCRRARHVAVYLDQPQQFIAAANLSSPSSSR